MIFISFPIDQDIIKIDNNKFTNEIPQHMMNKTIYSNMPHSIALESPCWISDQPSFLFHLMLRMIFESHFRNSSCGLYYPLPPRPPLLPLLTCESHNLLQEIGSFCPFSHELNLFLESW
ncbi:hypothetical protein M9H77_03760 [Catharanthus roseus]|uniref:Uncharacterized protein n=1 Tax=Catharanthus roseus TaxID=4058 RepID=A0ACC0CCD0_CATRO|nr:hypothetical protein M9H77_03760 [Catharanthus roseus]